MKPFDYQRPQSLQETLELMSAPTRGRPLAGGTDLLTRIKTGLDQPQRLLDIKRLDGLSNAIDGDGAGDAITLGALVSLSDIETSEPLRRRYPALAQAAASAATPQLRNRATLAGNLLQRPRCWYYRHPHADCWLQGGDDCPAQHGRNRHHALFGDGPCKAVHPSDLASALLALDAEVTVTNAHDERRIAIADLFDAPQPQRRRETVLDEDQLITAVHLPALPDGSRSVYLKAMERQTWAFALVGVAAAVTTDGERIEQVRLVASGVANTPWRLRDAERVLLDADAGAGAEAFERAADVAVADARPLSENGYKIPLLKGLIRQALAAVCR